MDLNPLLGAKDASLPYPFRTSTPGPNIAENEVFLDARRARGEDAVNPNGRPAPVGRYWGLRDQRPANWVALFDTPNRGYRFLILGAIPTPIQDRPKSPQNEAPLGGLGPDRRASLIPIDRPAFPAFHGGVAIAPPPIYAAIITGHN